MFTLKCFLAALFVVCFGALATQAAWAPYVAQDSNCVRIGNGLLEIEVRRDNGGVRSIVDKRSGVDLCAAKEGAWPLLWGILVVTPQGVRDWVDNPTTDSFQIVSRSTSSEARLELKWQGLRLRSGQRYPATRVIVTMSVFAGSPLSIWSIKVESPSALMITEIHFPLLSGIDVLGKEGDDDRLVVPDQEGRLFHNPARRLKWWGQAYPSAFMNMQWLAYYDAHAGFLISARDVTGQSKMFYWDRGGSKDAHLGCAHLFPASLETNLVVPYEVIVGTFRGDWCTAADIYKEWASQQWWVRQARVKETPEWLRSVSLGMEFCAHGCTNEPGDKTFDAFIRQVKKNQEFFGLPTLAMLWGWEKYGAWYHGDYFPPFEGWTKFDEVVQCVHESNSYLNVFIGAWFVETSTALWKSGVPQAFAMRNPDGTIKLAYWEPGREWAFMDVSTEYWKQHLIKVVSILAEHGVDCVQLDGFPWIEPQDYFSTHGHPLGRGGNWQAQAWIDALQRIRTTARAVKPDIVLSGEGGAELFLPYLDVYHSRDCWAEFFDEKVREQGAEVIPLFEYVYHPYIVFLGQYNLCLWKPLGGSSYHLLALARTLTWGHIPNYNLQQDLRHILADDRALNYLKAIGTARRSYAARFLVRGEMLKPISVASPFVTVSTEGGRYSGRVPAVQHSAWRAVDGTIGVILTNIGEQPVTATVYLDFERLGLKEGERYVVRMVGYGNEELVLSNMTRSTSLAVTVDPLEIKVLTIDVARTVGWIQPHEEIGSVGGRSG